MAWREKLYERRLKRPVSSQTLEADALGVSPAKARDPRADELFDHPTRPEMTIKSKWLSFIVQFNKETMRVDAELSLAAKMLATTENRQVAIQFIDRIANDLNL